MAATALTVQEITRSGLDPAYTAANGDGHTISNDGSRTFVHVQNGGGSPITVTLTTTITVGDDDLAVADPTVSVPAGEDRMIGPFPQSEYSSSLTVTFSDVTSVTVAALKIST